MYYQFVLQLFYLISAFKGIWKKNKNAQTTCCTVSTRWTSKLDMNKIFIYEFPCAPLPFADKFLFWRNDVVFFRRCVSFVRLCSELYVYVFRCLLIDVYANLISLFCCCCCCGKRKSLADRYGFEYGSREIYTFHLHSDWHIPIWIHILWINNLFIHSFADLHVLRQWWCDCKIYDVPINSNRLHFLRFYESTECCV